MIPSRPRHILLLLMVFVTGTIASQTCRRMAWVCWPASLLSRRRSGSSTAGTAFVHTNRAPLAVKRKGGLQHILSPLLLRSTTSFASTTTNPGLMTAEQLFPTSFELDIPPMGHVLGLRLPQSSVENVDLSVLVERAEEAGGAAAVALLHPDELRLALSMSNDAARLAFVGGRLALRRNLRNLPCPPSIKRAVLRDKTGAPMLPRHVQASISHKKDLAVCLLRSLAGSEEEHEQQGKPVTCHIGVDVEICQPRVSSTSVATRVLTVKEQGELGSLTSVGISPESEVLLRFSFKESVYKALYPFVRRYVAFKEAETTPHPDGTCDIVLHLKGGSTEGVYEVKGCWRRVDDQRFFLTAVKIRQTQKAAHSQSKL